MNHGARHPAGTEDRGQMPPVIYEIRKEDVVVLVVKVGLRRNDEVYRAVLKRLG